MSMDLQALLEKDYPGRGFIIGKPNKTDILIAYFLTGRQELFQSRYLAEESNCVFVRPSSKNIARKLDPDIHFYPAIIWNKFPLIGNYNIAVSNGKQTTAAHSSFLAHLESPINALTDAHEDWTYENDPEHTPRISCCIANGKTIGNPQGYGDKAAMGIIKRGLGGQVERHYFEIPLITGKGKLMTTYDGPDVKSPPAFKGEPLDVQLANISADNMARAIYDRLHNGYKIGVAVLYYNTQTHEKTIKRINKHASP